MLKGARLRSITLRGCLNEWGGCVRAHGCHLAGKMTGGPPNQIGGQLRYHTSRV